MTKQTALEKRVKRHLIGKPQRFFASTPPGSEKICKNELEQLLPEGCEAETLKGGVTFVARLHEGFLANLHLRTAGRILMRIGRLRASNFAELEKRADKIPWEHYIKAGEAPEFKVAASQSRLYHTGAIEERLDRVVRRKLGPPTPGRGPKPTPQTLYVRADNDEFTFSIDCSGNPLHKRGLKTQVGPAPLRETLASTILNLVGYTGKENIVDPLCGSGTFALEAAMIAHKIPAGWFRDFAFQGWPSFRETRWRAIRREAEKEFVKIESPRIYSSDQDEHTCRLFRGATTAFGFDKIIIVKQASMFDVLPPPDIEPGIVVLNPPYGKRLGSKTEAIQLLKNIGTHLHRSFGGWKFALLVPGNKSPVKLPFPTNSHRIHHGGLDLTLLWGNLS